MMFKRVFIPLIAIGGVALAIFLVIRGSAEVKPSDPVAQPSEVPFQNFVSGSGIVEASSENIEVGTQISGIVKEVYVDVGDYVDIGTPLFRLDDRDYQAKVRQREAEVKVAQAKVLEAEAFLADAQDRLALVQKLTDRRALSQEEVDRRTRAVEIAETQLQIADANLQKAQRDREAAQIDLDRLTVRSPIACRVLQVDILPGEYATAGNQSLIMVGCDNPLHVRVDIDENDAWRFNPKGEAIGTMRGYPDLTVPLTFVEIEPLIIPKKSLTKDSSGRVDTRVLQVIYSFDPTGLPIYIGQQMDVSIASDEKR